MSLPPALQIAIAALSSTVAAYAHWRRFQVPITVAAGFAALAVVVIATLVAAADIGTDKLPYLILPAGLGMFALAMRWDLSDPLRKTRRADVAFWLHLLASPLLVHSAFVILGLLTLDAQMGKVAVVFALYAALAALALIIDRRALMVSALAYVIYAMSTMFKQFGVVSSSVAITWLVIGATLLLLSAFWSHLRAGLVQRLPDHWQARLPATSMTAPH